MKSFWKFGVRYSDGKVLIFRATKQGHFYEENPGEIIVPSWAVDIREVIAMVFAGAGSLCLIFRNEINYAMVILVGLLMYATGRTVPGGKPSITNEQLRFIVAEVNRLQSH